jgi:hypothetical protein
VLLPTRSVNAKARKRLRYIIMPELLTHHLERSQTPPSLAPQADRLIALRIAEALSISEGAASQWMTHARDGGPTALRHYPPLGGPRRLTAEQLARLPTLLQRRPTVWGCGGDVWTRRRFAWSLTSPTIPRMSAVCAKPSGGVDKNPPGAPASATKRRLPTAAGDLVWHQEWAQEQHQNIFFIDESGFYLLPSVVRSHAPVGHTPILREWWTREHLSDPSPEGQLYLHSQDHATNSEDVVAFLAHLLCEVAGRLVTIWTVIASRNSWRMAPPTGSMWSPCLRPGTESWGGALDATQRDRTPQCLLPRYAAAA